MYNLGEIDDPKLRRLATAINDEKQGYSQISQARKRVMNEHLGVSDFIAGSEKAEKAIPLIAKVKRRSVTPSDWDELLDLGAADARADIISKSKSAIAEARPEVVILGDASSTELTVKEYALKPWALRLSVAMSRK
jgi:hypothetical protein